MRYLVEIKTGKVTEVPETDDAKFYKLVGERDENGRPEYEQTGAHDPRVSKVKVTDERPAATAKGD